MIALIINSLFREHPKTIGFLEWLDANNIEYKAYHDDVRVKAEETREFCRGSERVIIVGGDGTLNVAINAINDLGIPYGLIPCGTGNDVAIALCIKKLEGPELYETAVFGDYTDVDVWSVNGNTLFVLAMTYGIPVLINKIHEYEDVKARNKQIAKTTMEYVPSKFEVKCGDQICEKEMILLSIQNTCTIGNGLMICDKSEYGDGELEAVCTPKSNKLRLILNMKKLHGAGLSHGSNVITLKGPRIELTTGHAEECMLDGEAYFFDHAVIEHHGKIKIANTHKGA